MTGERVTLPPSVALCRPPAAHSFLPPSKSPQNRQVHEFFCTNLPILRAERASRIRRLQSRVYVRAELAGPLAPTAKRAAADAAARLNTPQRATLHDMPDMHRTTGMSCISKKYGLNWYYSA